MGKKGMLSTQQVAERLGRPYSTIALWVRQGRFKSAEAEDTPRGKVWWIPESDLKSFITPKLGRPAKAKAKKQSLPPKKADKAEN